MQARRGRGHRAVVPGKQRLVVGAVLRIGHAASYVGRQRHGAALFEGRQESRTHGVEGEHDRAVLVFGLDPGGESAGEGEPVAWPQPLGRPREGQPAPAAQIADQERLDRDVLTAGRATAHALQSRRDHPGVVEDQEVAAAQQARQIAHMSVVQAVGRDIQKPRRIPRSDRALGDEIVGKIEIEEVDAHGGRV